MTDVVSGTERAVEVAATGDEIRARNVTEAVAAELGFDEGERADLGQVAIELATNVVKYADSGTISVHGITVDSERGIRVTATDSGPGFADVDVDTAFAVGASSGGTLGYGLTAVNQLVDTIEIGPRAGPDRGTRIVAERWLRSTRVPTVPCPAAVGVATRAISDDLPNGDSFVVKSWNDETLVGVIDGLGHGPEAHKASIRARNYVESHYDRPLEAIFRGTERTCKSTRGVVMALARFDWADETVTVANVGNISLKVSGPDRTGFIVRRGVVGGNGPAPSVVTEEWKPHYTMILHSDGIATRWDWGDVAALGDSSPSRISNWLLEHYGVDDDATAVTVTGGTDE